LTSATRAAVSVPLYALRRAENDPGVGKFTDLGRYYKEELAKQGVDAVLLLPHFAVLGDSPYAPVSLYALDEDNVDWSEVDEVRRSPALLARLNAPDLARRQSVDYADVREREGLVSREAFAAFSREELTQAVHDNLRNLGLDALEVVNLRSMFNVHHPAEGSLEAPLTVLAELQRQGLVRHIGLSNVTRAQIAEGRLICEIACVQNYYNLAHRDDDALIDELAPPQAESVAARTAVSAQAPSALTMRRCGRRRAFK